MKDYKIYFFHLDGLLTNRNLITPYTYEVMNLLKKQNKKVFYLTNQLERSGAKIKKQLESLGLKVALNQLITPIHAIQEYFGDKTRSVSIFIVGSELIKDELRKKGSHIIETSSEKTKGEVYVLLALSNNMEYEQLQQSFFLLQRGAKLVILNPDLLCSTTNRTLLDSGSIARVYMSEQSMTNVKKDIIGKPSIWMQQVLLRKVHNQHGRAVMIGASLTSDIAIGQAIGIDTILLTSGHTVFDLDGVKQKPTYVFPEIKDLYYEIKGRELV
ncbi:HAD-IIA family hydrolase [Alkalihalobacterium elongatum]|uniref:HAD-IIA family hydrolase n=1 Tax=Alkalihalobacterium elongatum TaxID=2675466 RepID=UPI001C1FB39D|nr:HAD-IIA family hydrolase [Alkalihalobacterium elongatum]